MLQKKRTYSEVYFLVLKSNIMLMLIFYYKNEISFICIYNACFLVLSGLRRFSEEYFCQMLIKMVTLQRQKPL